MLRPLAMAEGDVFASTHRSPRQEYDWRGARIRMPRMAELYGKIEGCLHGHGRLSMHLYDVERGISERTRSWVVGCPR